jgi:uncharacterized membrane protein YkvA (DUF1232 family)
VRGLLIGLGVALAAWAALVVVLVLAGRRTAARELATFLPNLLLLFRGLLRDPRVSLGAKALLVLAVAWVASPIDLVPEFVPLAGPLDDAIVAALVLRAVLRRTDRDVLLEHWRGDPATLDRLVGRARPA